MKTARPLSVTATLLGISLMPLTTNAASEHDAIQVCSKAMIQRVENRTGITVLDFAVKGELANSSTRLREPTSYSLSAANPQTGTVVATARCVVSKRARIQSLKVWPLSTGNS